MTGSWGRLPSGTSTADRAANSGARTNGSSHDVVGSVTQCVPTAVPPVVTVPPAVALPPGDEARYRAAEHAWWDAVGVSPEERWVELPGLGTTVRVLEVGEGPPVLFVHGAGSGATGWAPLAARLAGRHRCLLVDRPGCGLSPAPPPSLRFGAGARRRRVGDPYDGFAALADELAVAVLDGLGVERASIVATSLGGYVGLRAAAAHADRVERLVCLGWPVGAVGGPVPLALRLGSIGWLGRLGARVPVGERMVRSMLKRIGVPVDRLGSEGIGPDGIGWFRALSNRTVTAGNELAAVPPVFGWRQSPRPEILLPDRVLRRIEAPVLLVWGTDDPFGGTAAAEAFAPRIPDARLCLVGAGHAPWLDAPDLVAVTTAAFLAGHPI